MTLAQAMKRIEELEARVKGLEARPETHIHHHYSSPNYLHQPVEPFAPLPDPWRGPWKITCGGDYSTLCNQSMIGSNAS